MSDVLIKNMGNNPKDCILEEHLLDGTVIKHEVVEVPPHGDLIERSPLVQKIKDEWQKIHEETGYDVKGIFWNKLVEIIESSEVVLEAST